DCAPVAARTCGLRPYHEHLGAPVDELPLAMPVSTRTDDDAGGGNHFSAVRLAAPVGLVDPVARMQDVRAQILQAGHEPAMDVLASVGSVVSHLPRPVIGH